MFQLTHKKPTKELNKRISYSTTQQPNKTCPSLAYPSVRYYSLHRTKSSCATLAITCPSVQSWFCWTCFGGGWFLVCHLHHQHNIVYTTIHIIRRCPFGSTPLPGWCYGNPWWWIDVSHSHALDVSNHTVVDIMRMKRGAEVFYTNGNPSTNSLPWLRRFVHVFLFSWFAGRPCHTKDSRQELIPVIYFTPAIRD